MACQLRLPDEPGSRYLHAMSLLDASPLFRMTIHRSLLPEIKRGDIFILGEEEILVAGEPRIEGEFWCFMARRNERPNA